MKYDIFTASVTVDGGLWTSPLVRSDTRRLLEEALARGVAGRTPLGLLVFAVDRMRNRDDLVVSLTAAVHRRCSACKAEEGSPLPDGSGVVSLVHPASVPDMLYCGCNASRLEILRRQA